MCEWRTGGKEKERAWEKKDNCLCVNDVHSKSVCCSVNAALPAALNYDDYERAEDSEAFFSGSRLMVSTAIFLPCWKILRSVKITCTDR